MPKPWTTVRIFISSTFRDMHAERDHLVKVVFPALREQLEPHRIHLVDVDLRWGVTKAQAENDRALDLCLGQVDECRPFFLGLLGGRYGWIPERFPAETLKRFGWVQAEPGRSVTELEILHGVLLRPAARGHAFFYFRDAAALRDIPEPLRSTTYAEADPGIARTLADLKERIRRSGLPVLDDYPARWDPNAPDRPTKGKGRLVGLELLGRRVYDDLLSAIRNELRLGEAPVSDDAPPDPFAEEREHHERFMESRLRVYVGRGRVHDALLGYAEATNGPPAPCVVTGPSGCGKSAALARFLTDYRRRRPEVLTLAHFVGAGPRSTSLRELLTRICRELLREALDDGRKARLAEAGSNFLAVEDIEKEYAVPDDAVALAATCARFLGMTPASRRILLAIDALDQLDAPDRAGALDWLPEPLPPHVRIVLSCVEGATEGERLPAALRARAHVPIPVSPLTEEERNEIVRAVPSLSAKALDDEQVRLLLANPATKNPLFLQVALEELRGFGSYEQLNERIRAFPGSGARAGPFRALLRLFRPARTPSHAEESDPVKALFEQVLERMEQEFDKEVVRTALRLLATARRGLSEAELKALVADHPGADDLFPVLRQLRSYLLSRGGLLGFFHAGLAAAVRARYLHTPDNERAAHARLGDHFEAEPLRLEDAGNAAVAIGPARSSISKPANARKVDELVWQRLAAGQGAEAGRLLADIRFLEAKTEAGMVLDLADDCRATVRNAAGQAPLAFLPLIEETLRRHAAFLQKQPSALFQCLWNSGRWQADAKGLGDAPGSPGGTRLPALLDAWRRAKEAAGEGRAWLRALRPPPSPLGTALRVLFHGDPVVSVACSPGGTSVATAGGRCVKVWDAGTGDLLHTMRTAEDVKSVDLVGGPRVLPRARNAQERLFLDALPTETPELRVAYGAGGVVRVVEPATGRTIARFEHERGEAADAGGRVAFSPDGRRVASTWQPHGPVCVWDAATGAPVHALSGHLFVDDVSWAPDGSRLVGCGGDEGATESTYEHSVRVWDAESGRELAVLKVGLWTLAYSRDGRRLVGAGVDTENVVVVQDARDMAMIARHGGIDVDPKLLALSPDGRRAASRGADNSVRVYELEFGTPVAVHHGHEGPISSLVFLGDGERLLSGSADGTARIWPAVAESPSEDGPAGGHEAEVTSLEFSPDGRRLASGANDRTVRVWDAASGAELRVLREGEANVEALAFSPDSGRLAVGCGDGVVRIWDVERGEKVLSIGAHRAWVNAVAWSPDGRRLATAGEDREGLDGGEPAVRVFDAAGGAELLGLVGQEGDVRCLAFSPDSRRLLTAADVRREPGAPWTVPVLSLWEVETGALVRSHRYQTLTDWGIEAARVAWSPDGTRIGTLCPPTRSMSVRDGESLAQLSVVEARGDPRAVAAGSERFPFLLLRRSLEKDAVLVSAATGAELTRFPADLDRIAQHPDGRTFAAAAGSHVYLLRLEGGENKTEPRG
ncbi:MAG: DUF4062 domain-containing protein [Planctomycetes bacterium]|nr:DUF4062 domain-containing protein [Planctomycetota bacterium]